MSTRRRSSIAIRLTLPLLLSCSIIAFVVSCGKGYDAQQVRFDRLERVMLDTDDAGLRDALRQFAEEHQTPLIRLFPDDEQFMSFVEGFRHDEVTRDIDKVVRQRYGDLGWLEKELGDALGRAKAADEEIDYQHFFTYIGNEGYGARVKADKQSKTLVVEIAQYVVPQMQHYGFFGDPMYIVRVSDSAYIAADCMAEIFRQHVAMPETEPTLLDYMIAEGKVLYCLRLAMPKVDDTILLRYSSEQLEWMQANEANVWSYFVQKKMLFLDDMNQIHNFVEDAPKTNAFSDSAPRTAAFIGWHIIEAYAEAHKEMTLRELLEQTDAQKILSDSHYRPR